MSNVECRLSNIGAKRRSAVGGPIVECRSEAQINRIRVSHSFSFVYFVVFFLRVFRGLSPALCD